MKSSLKVIVAALALATAGGAFAQNGTGTTNGTDTYFYAYDNSTASSFLIDLGSNVANFNGSVSEDFSTIGSNAAYQAFAGAVTDGLIEWGVFSASSTGATTGNVLNVTNGNATSPSTKAKYLITDIVDINTLMAGVAANVSTPMTNGVLESGAVAQNAQSSVGANTNLVGVAAVNAIGASASYISYNVGTSTGITAVTPTAFAGTWKFTGSDLSYTVAAVPEPSSYMMMLAGLLMLGGLVARRRNSK
jgi:hypothetical protein